MTTGIKMETIIKTASWVATAILLTGCNAGASGDGSAASYDVSSTNISVAATQPTVASYSSTTSVSTVSAKPSPPADAAATEGCDSTVKNQGRWATCTTENQAPVLTGTAPTTVKAGSAYSFKPTASDANNDKLRFAINNLPSWARFNATNGTLAGTPGIEHLGIYGHIQISVNDGVATTYGPAFSIEVYTDVVVPPANTAPVIGGTAPSSVVAGSPYFFRPQASDANGDALSFAVQNLPAWAGFNAADGTLSGIPSSAHAGSYANVVISVSDGKDVAALAPFTITVTAANRAPVISGNPATSVTAGQSYRFAPSASDADGDALTFSVTNKPAWASFDSKTGVLSGTPADTHVGSYAGVTISVTDGKANASITPFTIAVTAANRAPVISGFPATSITAGQAYRFAPTASDADGDTLTFSVANKPVWASFDSKTGVLSGTPASTHVGSYAGVTISVTDGKANASITPFTIAVTATNRPPVISGTPAASITAGQAYRFAPTASDADGDTLTFSVVYLPIWASFDSKTGTLSGTPTENHVGTYSNIRISVSDSKVTTSGSAFNIAVMSGNSAPVLSGTPTASVIAGEFYSFVPTASDVDGDTLSFSMQNLPAWARFDNTTGAITGTPAGTDVGVYGNLRISVSDGSETTSGSVFSIEVLAGNSAPTLSGTPAGSVNAGAAYSFVPTASDADGDALSFSVQNLPAWASFDAGTGKLSGTPTDADVALYSNIVISVTDGDLQTSGPAFSIQVTQISLGSATLSWTAPTQNMDGSTLTDLAGFKLYYGTTEGNYTEQITVNNPGISTFVVDNLSANTYYFVATAYNAAGVESPYSGVAVKVVN